MSGETRVLLTGATGYVGGRLLRALEAEGIPLRCLARRAEHLAGRVGPDTEILQGDVLDRASLDRALSGVTAAYHLVHSMGSPGQFEEQDRRGAANFGAASRDAGVRRIIYLRGLGEPRFGLCQGEGASWLAAGSRQGPGGSEKGRDVALRQR